MLNNNRLAGNITPSLGHLVVAKLIDLSANEGLLLKDETKAEIQQQLGQTVVIRV